MNSQLDSRIDTPKTAGPAGQVNGYGGCFIQIGDRRAGYGSGHFYADQAVRLLGRKGVNAARLEDGYPEWKEAHFPVAERKSSVRPVTTPGVGHVAKEPLVKHRRPRRYSGDRAP